MQCICETIYNDYINPGRLIISVSKNKKIKYTTDLKEEQLQSVHWKLETSCCLSYN